MSNLDIPALRALGDAATPGEWRKCGADRGGCQCGNIWSEIHDVHIVSCVGEKDADQPIPFAIQQANADFIVAARNSWTQLLDEVERLRQRESYLQVAVTEEESRANELARTIHTLRAELAALKAAGTDAE